MGLQTTWGLTPDVIRDIEAVCDEPASIYRHLQTHSNYWGPKILARQGVKRATVLKMAREFLRLLRSVHDNRFTGTGVDLETARRLYKKYEPLCLTENTESMLEQVK